MSEQVRFAVAAALAVLAIVASGIALVVSDETGPLRPVYAPLGPAFGRLAQAVELREDLVPRATYGREFASAHGAIDGSKTDDLDVEIERITPRGQEPTTHLTVGVSRYTGGDVLHAPWAVSLDIPNEDFVLEPDFSRIVLDTQICDERDGATKRLIIEWTMHGPFLTRPPYGMLARYGGDARFTARFGEQELTGADLAIVNMQVWSRPLDHPEGPGRAIHRIEGSRTKAVRCQAEAPA